MEPSVLASTVTSVSHGSTTAFQALLQMRSRFLLSLSRKLAMVTPRSGKRCNNSSRDMLLLDLVRAGMKVQ